MTKKGEPVRLGDADKIGRLFHKFKHSDPEKAYRYYLRAKFIVTLGWHNLFGEYLPKPGRRPGEGGMPIHDDEPIVTWALLQAGEEPKPYKLAGQYFDGHEDELHHEASREAFVKRVGAKIKQSLT